MKIRKVIQLPFLSRVLPQVTQSINKSSVLLLTEMCTFIVHCMHQKRQLIERVAQEYRIVDAIISVLNIELFGEFSLFRKRIHRRNYEQISNFYVEIIPKSVKHECWSEVLTVLKWLSRSPIGFQAICNSFEQNRGHLGNAFNIFAYGLTCKGKRQPHFAVEN